MTKAVPALLTILLVCALPATAAVAALPSQPTDRDPGQTQTLSESTAVPAATLQAGPAAPSPMLDGSAENTTNRLGLDDVPTETYTSPGADFGTTVAMDDDELSADFDRYRAEHEWDQQSRVERQEAIATLLDRVENRTDALETRERDAVAAHAAGDASTDAVVRTLARTDRESRTLAESLDFAEELGEEIVGYTVDTQDDSTLLEAHQSEVRILVTNAFEARSAVGDSDAVLVQSTENGAVVSTTDGEFYYREATRFDNRDPDAGETLDWDEAQDRVATELYPWAWSEDLGNTGSKSFDSLTSSRLAQFYGIDLTTHHGQVEASLDGGTGEIFSERQRLRVDDLPTTSVDRWENESIQLSANRTAVNGPAEVTTTDVVTNTSADATIVVDGYHLGETGEDGSLWIVPPATTHELSAEVDERTVNGTVTPG